MVDLFGFEELEGVLVAAIQRPVEVVVEIADEFVAGIFGGGCEEVVGSLLWAGEFLVGGLGGVDCRLSGKGFRLEKVVGDVLGGALGDANLLALSLGVEPGGGDA